MSDFSRVIATMLSRNSIIIYVLFTTAMTRDALDQQIIYFLA